MTISLCIIATIGKLAGGRYGGLRNHEVANIEEAVELANKLRPRDATIGFAGQVKDWPPCLLL